MTEGAARRGAPVRRLFTTMFPADDPVRRREYLTCLARNLACATIDEVCVLAEGAVDFLPASEKLRVRPVANRPLYDDFFAWINEVAGPDDVSVIANTDIWFDAGIAVAARTLRGRACLALARWEGDRLFDRPDSQDCWVFRGPVAGVRGDFPLGVVRCDNRILYELQAAGYTVRNPSFSVRARHLHAGEREDYGETLPHYVQPPYRYLWPHNLFGPVRTLVHNLRHPDARVGWRFDRRRAARTLPARAAARLVRLLKKGLAPARPETSPP